MYKKTSNFNSIRSTIVCDRGLYRGEGLYCLKLIIEVPKVNKSFLNSQKPTNFFGS